MKPENKKFIANQLVSFYKKLKISFIVGFIWFVGFSIYSKLVHYSIFNSSFKYSEAVKILGYSPKEYQTKGTLLYYVTTEDFTYITDKNGVILNDNEEPPQKPVYSYPIPTDKNVSISKSNVLLVKKNIINKLLKDLIKSTLYIMLATFLLLILISFSLKLTKWVKEFAD